MPMASATTWTSVSARLTPVASATVRVTSTSAVALTSPKETATAMATSLTPWGSVVATAPRTRMPMASATTSTNALANLTNAAFAMAQVLCLAAFALRFPKGIAIAMATSLTPWGSVVAIAPRTLMPMASATMWTTASDPLTRVAFAMAQETSSSVDVLTFPKGICDCDGNQLDALGVCGGDCAEDFDADGICDNLDECVGTLDACGICNGPGDIYECGCADIPEGDCDCDGNQLDALGVCGGDCAEDADADGICDDVDECVANLTNAAQWSRCLSCVCTDSRRGRLQWPEDGDGICDDWTRSLACDVCNSGDIFECDVQTFPKGDCDAIAMATGCRASATLWARLSVDIYGADALTSRQVTDCDGNQEDALGVCGGDCAPIRMPMASVMTWTTACDACDVCNGWTSSMCRHSRRGLRLRWQPLDAAIAPRTRMAFAMALVVTSIRVRMR